MIQTRKIFLAGVTGSDIFVLDLIFVLVFIQFWTAKFLFSSCSRSSNNFRSYFRSRFSKILVLVLVLVLVLIIFFSVHMGDVISPIAEVLDGFLTCSANGNIHVTTDQTSTLHI